MPCLILAYNITSSKKRKEEIKQSNHRTQKESIACRNTFTLSQENVKMEIKQKLYTKHYQFFNNMKTNCTHFVIIIIYNKKFHLCY